MSILKAWQTSSTTEVSSFDEFKEVLDTKGGFIRAFWDGSSETEEKIKELDKNIYNLHNKIDLVVVQQISIMTTCIRLMPSVLFIVSFSLFKKLTL